MLKKSDVGTVSCKAKFQKSQPSNISFLKNKTALIKFQEARKSMFLCIEMDISTSNKILQFVRCY